METKRFEFKDIKAISQEIKAGGMVAIPTDTVYGLAISTQEDENYQKLVKAKGRPDNKPFPLMVSSFEQLESVAELSERDRHLVHTFMPGAVTFVFKRKKEVFSFLEAFDTIGIRMADDAWVQALIDTVGYPLWLPSANLSGYDTATSSDMVLEQMDGLINGVVLGKSKAQLSSSVFDLSGEEITVLRQGNISLEAIMEEVN